MTSVFQASTIPSSTLPKGFLRSPADTLKVTRKSAADWENMHRCALEAAVAVVLNWGSQASSGKAATIVPSPTTRSEKWISTHVTFGKSFGHAKLAVLLALARGTTTKRRLAGEIDIFEHRLRDMEDDTADFKLIELQAISRFLGISLADLNLD